MIRRAPGAPAPYRLRVFLNVPFDRQYARLLRAHVFAIESCGLEATCALAESNAGDLRLAKILRLIRECRLGIHDLSRTTLDPVHRLPRFNMPLELGLFLGSQHFGSGRQRQKSSLVLDREQYRYQKFCSDLAGSDISAHGNKVEDAIRRVQHWLQSNVPGGHALPSAGTVLQDYVRFDRALRQTLRRRRTRAHELPFVEYRTLVRGWLARAA